MITVYGRATSSNVQAVLWGLAELGLEFEQLDYGHVHGGLDSAEFVAMTPHRLVPVLRDGEVVIWESCAILRYLGARYGAAPFWPADPVARSPVDMWAEWGKTTFCASFTGPIFWVRVRTAAAARDEVALSAAIRAFDGHLGTLEKQLAGDDYVTGDQFTLADIVIGHVLFRYFDMDIVRAERPVISAYYQRLGERAAYRARVMVSYDALRVGP
ncbi:MAG: glutathione S-transferase family protein [Paracoccaceae bacterium]